jgi:putative MATE family efflux protein
MIIKKYMKSRRNILKEKKQIDMINGSLWDKMILVALPLAASSILQQLFNAADVAVVGQFAGSRALAAVGANSAIISMFVTMIVGLSVGANVVIANLIGQDRKHEISDVVHTAVAFAIVLGLVMMALGLLIARPLLTLIDTPKNVLNLAVLYLRIYICGMPFIVLYDFVSAILRCVGDTKRPLYSLMISGTVNVALNLIFVICFNMGVAGVALATVISNVISSSILFIALTKENETIRLSIRRIAINPKYLARMIRIGFPAGLQGMIFSLSNVFIQTGINSFGSAAVAGSSAALNFEYITYYIVNAYNQTCVTFTSQNYGAGKLKRCRKVFWIAMFEGMFLTCILSLLMVSNRHMLVRIFTKDTAVISYAFTRMTMVMIVEMLTATYEISGAALRGMGHSMLPATLTIIGSCCFRIIWMYTVFPRFHKFEVLMAVYIVSWIITGTMVLTSYFIIRGKVERKYGICN